MYIGNLNINYFKFNKHQFDTIELDGITSQEISLDNDISIHTLETGEELADAIINKPEKITFSAVISDMPQNYKEELEMIKDITSSVFGSKRLRNSKSVRAWYDLHKLWKSKTLVMVTSPIQIEPFTNMSIENITVTIDNDMALKFTASLMHIRISENLKKLNLSDEVGKQSSRT